jgi:hypothetical protein
VRHSLFDSKYDRLPVSAQSEKAQYFFDQGLRLTYAFNHQEALRSFKEAARNDPDCGTAYWGWVLVLGPNLNLPMSPEVVPQAFAFPRSDAEFFRFQGISHGDSDQKAGGQV